MQTDYQALFAEHRAHVWGICYRVTGSRTDADDLVQDAFARAIERPPQDRDRPWRPWLARVATNLAIDHLRRRQARAYVGPWLPALVDTTVIGDAERDPARDPECRYGLLQSVRLAFLVALEALDPRARAVVVLRDVMGYSAPECAEILGVSAGSVRVTLHRARKQLEGYDQEARQSAAAGEGRAAAVLQAFFVALSSNDVATATACLAKDVQIVTDGGGHYSAATKVVTGTDNAMRLLLSLAQKSGSRVVAVEPRVFNAETMLLVRFQPVRERDAPIVVLVAEVDAEGRITVLRSISAPEKLCE